MGEPGEPAGEGPAAPGGMGLLLAVVHAADAGPAIEALTGAGWRVTRTPTVGGFLGQGAATLVIGVEPVHLPRGLGVLREQCRTRMEYFVPELGGLAPVPPVEVQVGGATIFVVDVERYERLSGAGAGGPGGRRPGPRRRGAAPAPSEGRRRGSGGDGVHDGEEHPASVPALCGLATE